MLCGFIITPEAKFFLIFAPPLCVLYVIWLHRRSSAILRRWASENGLEILERSLGPKTSYLDWLRRRRLWRADVRSFRLRYKSLGCPEDKYLWPRLWRVIYEVIVRD
jgi:hypothetical protein